MGTRTTTSRTPPADTDHVIKPDFSASSATADQGWSNSSNQDPIRLADYRAMAPESRQHLKLAAGAEGLADIGGTGSDAFGGLSGPALRGGWGIGGVGGGGLGSGSGGSSGSDRYAARARELQYYRDGQSPWVSTTEQLRRIERSLRSVGDHYLAEDLKALEDFALKLQQHSRASVAFVTDKLDRAAQMLLDLRAGRMDGQLARDGKPIDSTFKADGFYFNSESHGQKDGTVSAAFNRRR